MSFEGGGFRLSDNEYEIQRKKNIRKIKQWLSKV
jgi:hypothetical protein